MPGPLMTVTIRQTLKRGIWAVIFTVSAHALTEAFAVLGLLLGLGRFMSSAPVSGTVAVCGGLVMAWMACGMIKDALSNRLLLDLTLPGQAASKGAFLQGLLATVSNPYWLIWWATIGANFTGMSKGYGNAGLLAFYFGHILADFSWLLLIGIMLVKGRKLITDRIYRGITLVLGIFLAFFAVYFFISGIKFLIK